MISDFNTKKILSLSKKNINISKKESLKHTFNQKKSSINVNKLNISDRQGFDLKVILNNTKKPTFLYYLYTLRKRELESKKKINNSFLAQFKNSYRWSHYFLQKVNSSSLRKFYIAKKPFFKNTSFGRYSDNKYINNIPLLWIAKNLYWKIPLIKLHELLGIKTKKSLLNKNIISSSVMFTTNFITSYNFLNSSDKTFFSYIFKFSQQKMFKPFFFNIIISDITKTIKFLNYYNNSNFYEKNKLVAKRSHKFPLNYLISRKYPSYMILNYNLFSFCISKSLQTKPSFQLKLFLKNFIYYPVWYRSSFIY